MSNCWKKQPAAYLAGKRRPVVRVLTPWISSSSRGFFSRPTKRIDSGCRAWRMMNFRQRMGWIGVGLYLLASAAAFYYVFEINETYNKLALEHIQQHPKEPQEGTTWTHSLKVRLLSLPFWLWTIIFLIPYLQMFLFLYSCTRADPKTVGYCIIPICLAVICNRHQTFVKASNQISRLQLIDT
ncbi:lysosomal enzyme trafficking factor isoform X1 [Chamaea fasciata]|uniref:lysosomal enzyme trafficking factor isoform X1 n=1 Tax=Chamaea fasciata TaxID=190680 RepID=UPI003369E748